MKEKIAYYPTPLEIVKIMIGLSNNNNNILESGFGQGAFFDELIKNTKFNSLTGLNNPS